jgi:beta-glucosidase
MPRRYGRAARSAVSAVTAAACLAPVTAAPGTAAQARQAPAPAARAGGAPATGGGWRPDAKRQADGLVSQLTLEEKISLVHGDTFGPPGFAGHVPGIPRLGIPDLYLSDGPNGVGNGNTGVTAFPVAEADAASFDTNLVRQYGAALGAEHIGKGHNVALSPTINILRVPYWGRVAETFGEDPYLTSQMAAAKVRGLQSQHVIATPSTSPGTTRRATGSGSIPPTTTSTSASPSGRSTRSTSPGSRRPSSRAAPAR